MAAPSRKKNAVILAALGPHIAQQFLPAKRKEWREYISQVSQWKFDNFLAKYRRCCGTSKRRRCTASRIWYLIARRGPLGVIRCSLDALP